VALPLTPLGELATLPQTLWLYFKGPTSKGRAEEEEGKGRRGGRERRGMEGRGGAG